MSKLLTASLSAWVLCTAFGPAAAQQGSAPLAAAPANTIIVPQVFETDDLYDAVQAVAAADPVRDVEYVDFFNDGDYVALVRTDVCEGSVCRWDLISRVEGGYVVTGGSMAEQVSVIATDGGGKVIWSDGVIWAFTGDLLRPWGDMLESVQDRDARDEERDAVISHNEFWDPNQMVLSVYEVEPFGAPFNHKLVLVGGACCISSMNGLPFLILDPFNEVVFEGNSADRPYIYKMAPGKAAIISYRASGFRQEELNYVGEMR